MTTHPPLLLALLLALLLLYGPAATAQAPSSAPATPATDTLRSASDSVAGPAPAAAPRSMVGRVVDENGLPMAGVSVLLTTPPAEKTIEVAVTNSEGRYLLKQVPATGGRVAISFGGYFGQLTDLASATGADGSLPALNVVLLPMPTFQRRGKQAAQYRRKLRALPPPAVSSRPTPVPHR